MDGLTNRQDFTEYVEDKAIGRISAERYASMPENLEKEEVDLKSADGNPSNSVTANRTKPLRQRVCRPYKKYTSVTKLDRTILNTLIDKILICESDDKNGSSQITVESYYRFIGKTG